MMYLAGFIHTSNWSMEVSGSGGHRVTEDFLLWCLLFGSVGELHETARPMPAVRTQTQGFFLLMVLTVIHVQGKINTHRNQKRNNLNHKFLPLSQSAFSADFKITFNFNVFAFCIHKTND